MLSHGYKWEQGIERVGQIFCTIMSCVNSISFENAPDKAWRINIRTAGIFFNKMASVLLNFSNSARNLHARCANAVDIPVLAELDLSSDRATKTSAAHPASSKRPDTPPQGKNAARLSWQHPRAPHEITTELFDQISFTQPWLLCSKFPFSICTSGLIFCP